MSVCVLFLLQIVLFLTAGGSVIAQYHGYENGEVQQDVGYDSSLPVTGSLLGATVVGGKDVISHGKGRHNLYPTVQYVTPHSSGYGEPAGNLYSDSANYYGVEEHDSHSYGDGFGGGHGGLAGRVKIQVRLKKT